MFKVFLVSFLIYLFHQDKTCTDALGQISTEIYTSPADSEWDTPNNIIYK